MTTPTTPTTLREWLDEYLAMRRALGFQLDEKHLRRAGMDYWPLLDWEAVDHWGELEQKLAGHTFWCVENPAAHLLWDAEFSRGDVLVFGSETRGLPPAIVEQYCSRTLQLPMRPEVRSLNLASTVNTAVYEAVRQFGGLA